jgi:hypothetical protein
MRGGERSEARGGALPQRRRSAGTPQHGAMPEAEASLPPPAAADFLSGAPVTEGAPEPSPATPKNGEAEAWVGIFKNKAPKALERRRTPTHAAA